MTASAVFINDIVPENVPVVIQECSEQGIAFVATLGFSIFRAGSISETFRLTPNHDDLEYLADDDWRLADYCDVVLERRELDVIFDVLKICGIVTVYIENSAVLGVAIARSADPARVRARLQEVLGGLSAGVDGIRRTDVLAAA